MQQENKEDTPQDDFQKGTFKDGEERGPGVLGRIRGAFGAAGEGVVGAVDTVTGAEFREQFEAFTDAVTTTVVGVHQDQAALKESLSRLEARVHQDQAELRERLSRLEQRSPLSGWVVAFGVVSVLALVAGILALLMSL